MWKLKIFVAVIVLFCESKGIFSKPSDGNQEPQWILQLKLGMVNGNATVHIQDDRSTTRCPARRNTTGLTLEENITQIKQKSSLTLVYIDGGIYYFERQKTANYFEAMQFCKRHGMELLSIETEAENRNIMSYIKEKHNDIDHFWTSGNDLSVEGHYTWLSTGIPLSYTFWKPSLPDNVGDEDCIEIRDFGNDDYSWNDMPCMHSLNYICEVPTCSDFCMD